jgi:replicative DNA helicase
MDLINLNKKKQELKKRMSTIDPMSYGKIPPQAIDVEQAILGALMLQRDCYDVVATYLKEECFYTEAHQKIYKAIQRLVSKSQPVDTLTVCEELRSSEDLEMVGGNYYVITLTNQVVSAANIESHCRIVIQKYIQREIIRISAELISEAYLDTTDPVELLDQAEEQLSLVTDSLSFGDMLPMSTVLVQTIQHIENWRILNETRQGNISITGVPSGVADLDLVTRGWQDGDLIILAARPSVGKTAFVLNLVRNAARHLSTQKKGSVAMWSLEMKAVRLMLRMLAATSEVWLTKIQTGILSEADMKIIYTKGVKLLSELRIYFDDHPGLTIQKLRSKARRLKRKGDLRLIVIDYLQLMISEQRAGNREQEISKISRSLKLLAQELNIPIIALSQLNRAIESRSDPEPQLSDLRESGSLEQDADVVIFLYNYTDAETNENVELRNRRRVKVAKQRDGVLAKFDVDFKGDIQLFEQIEKIPGWVPVSEANSRFYTESRAKKEDQENPF